MWVYVQDNIIVIIFFVTVFCKSTINIRFVGRPTDGLWTLTWGHYFEREIKQQSVKWNHPTTPRENFKATPSAEKVMATVVWDAEGVILVYIMPCGEAINADLYI